jgi:hypothetical protein
MLKIIINLNKIRNSGDRYDTKRPQSHEMWERGAMSGQTTNAETYVEGKGERYDRHVPKDSNVLKGDGTFESATSNRADYQGGAGNDNK